MMGQATNIKDQTIAIIGTMSGTSMDGLDIAYVEFSITKDSFWQQKVIACETYSYPEQIFEQLKQATNFSVVQYLLLDKELGKFYGEKINDFIEKFKLDKKKITAISSHGHTIFHQPENGFTAQIGCGTTIAKTTNIQVINDFRTKDVINSGQGAPLVPIGEKHLYSSLAESFINIGGFTNITIQKSNHIIAFDISPGNLPLNKLVACKNIPYDKDGELAKAGDIDFFLLDSLNSLDYYKENGPKSLGTEWLEQNFYPLLQFDRDIENNLRTVIEHIAIQISTVLSNEKIKSVLITGGGAKNCFLIERIKNYYKGKIVLPNTELIDYKEAIIFAFLGALYLAKEPNTIHTVTGANKDVCAGVLHTP
jgi:anhydro-N-acetylmuramic acid kinase